MSGNYPIPLKSVLKAVPCLVMALGFSTAFYIANYAYIKHQHDHIPRFSFRSTRFGLYTRQRDDRNRATFEKMLNYDPNVRATAADPHLQAR